MTPTTPLVLATLLGCAAAAKGSGRSTTPLLSTDIVWATGDLLYDIYDTTYSNFLAEPLAKHGGQLRTTVLGMVPPDMVEDPLGMACKTVGLSKAEVQAQQALVMSQVDTLMAEAQIYKTMLYTDLPVRLNANAARAVELFETALPKQKGLIPKNWMDLLLFTFWMTFVLYFLIQAFSFALRLALRVLSCVCCCGCCCLRRSKKAPAAAKEAPKKQNGAAAKQAAAPANGKKAAAKANGKK